MSSFDLSSLTDGSPPRRGPSVGQLVLGVTLLVIGTAWLLTALDVVGIPWRGLLALLLLVVGVALLWIARTGSHGGLIAFGVVLTIVLSVTSTLEGVFDVSFSGGIGDRVAAPSRLTGEEAPFRLAIGKLTVDLTETALPTGDVRIEASVAIGDLEIRVPEGVAVEVRGRASAGQIVVDRGPEWSGTAVDEVYRDADFATSAIRLTIDARVGLGQIEVRR